MLSWIGSIDERWTQCTRRTHYSTCSKMCSTCCLSLSCPVERPRSGCWPLTRMASHLAVRTKTPTLCLSRPEYWVRLGCSVYPGATSLTARSLTAGSLWSIVLSLLLGPYRSRMQTQLLCPGRICFCASFLRRSSAWSHWKFCPSFRWYPVLACSGAQ